jgi:hypothetical protein
MRRSESFFLIAMSLIRRRWLSRVPPFQCSLRRSAAQSSSCTGYGFAIGILTRNQIRSRTRLYRLFLRRWASRTWTGYATGVVAYPGAATQPISPLIGLVTDPGTRRLVESSAHQRETETTSRVKFWVFGKAPGQQLKKSPQGPRSDRTRRSHLKLFFCSID